MKYREGEYIGYIAEFFPKFQNIIVDFVRHIDVDIKHKLMF